ncbi:MAG TPA: dimethylsulfonioproprionate lyase family protein [Chthonomonadaceae bacterium]|nr:dimethylsulfonioproprionate lyase family protein [Chthonomonadaceae bacterium]
MAEITQFKGYDNPNPVIPKPEIPVEPMILTVQEGVPVAYPGCHGLGVRVVHPVNPKAPAKNLGLVLFYLPPHTKNPPGSHETEETYIILEGRGVMTFANGRQEQVEKGMFIYLPPWCEHGIENTGTETLVVLIATSPPNP